MILFIISQQDKCPGSIFSQVMLLATQNGKTWSADPAKVMSHPSKRCWSSLFIFDATHWTSKCWYGSLFKHDATVPFQEALTVMMRTKNSIVLSDLR